MTVKWGTFYYVAPAPSVAAVANLPPPVIHLPTPEPTRALYLTQCAATAAGLRDRILKLADETEINAVVVDLKDYSGTTIFPSTTALPGGRGCTLATFADLVKLMHEKQIYVIGRLTVFQDPLYAKTYPEQAVQSVSSGGPWKDRKGLSFVDVGSRPFWDYIVTLAREAEALGVDEINFDYIRYPSDGNMRDAVYQELGASHPENLEKFFAYLKSNLQPLEPKTYNLQPVLSADLFGMTATNEDDLGIGQVLERTLPYFDFVDPMVYPSHYPNGFNGWADPNQKSYEIVRLAMETAVTRTLATTTRVAALTHERIGTTTPAVYRKPAYPASKIRPWLQDFDYPIPYSPAMVKAQIQATYDAGLNSWLMWDPRNEYTPSVYQLTNQGGERGGEL